MHSRQPTVKQYVFDMVGLAFVLSLEVWYCLIGIFMEFI
jgi:hypothetical protein